MRNKLAAFVLAAPLLFCSPQTTSVPVAPVGSALPVVVSVDGASTAKAAPPSPMLQQRIDAAGEVFNQSVTRYSSGQATLDEVGLWSERLFAAQKDSYAGATLQDAATARVNNLKKLEALASQKVTAGLAPSSDVAKAKYFRASAELDLSRL